MGGSSQPEWRASAAGRPLEVRVQERQEPGENPVHRATAPNIVEPCRRARVWVLRQRESNIWIITLEQVSERRIGETGCSPSARRFCSTVSPGWPTVRGDGSGEEF